MQWLGKATETAARVVSAFERGDVPAALAQTFLDGAGLHSEGYSAFNRFLVAMAGYSDARGFHQWLAAGRAVRKGEKALLILAPCTRRVSRTGDDGEQVDSVIPTGFRAVPVFGLEQTDVVDDAKWEMNRPDPESARQVLQRLPLVRVAESWGLSVLSYKGRPGRALGYYKPGNGIALGVANLATWAHELIHAADDRLGSLKFHKKEEKADAELVAELGRCTLLSMLGFEHEADVGGAWQYVSSWAGQNAAESCRKLIDRVSRCVSLILATADDLESGEDAQTVENPEPACVPSAEPATLFA